MTRKTRITLIIYKIIIFLSAFRNNYSTFERFTSNFELALIMMIMILRMIKTKYFLMI